MNRFCMIAALPLIGALVSITPPAHATTFDTGLTPLSASDFASNSLPSDATKVFAIANTFSITDNYSTLYVDSGLTPSATNPCGTCSGLSDSSFSTSYGVGVDSFNDPGHYILAISNPGSNAISDYFANAGFSANSGYSTQARLQQ